MYPRFLHLQFNLKRLLLGLLALVLVMLHLYQIQETNKDNPERPWEYYDFSKIPSDKDKNNSTTFNHDVSKFIRSLPLEYWNTRDPKSNRIGCGGLSSIYDLKFSNNFWQILDHSNGTFYLLNSYYDNRTKSGRPTVRTIATVNRLGFQNNITCQLWFPGITNPIYVPVAEYKYMWLKAWGLQTNSFQQPYLISCDIPEAYKNKIPVAVSLVEKKCDKATNLLKVHNKKPISGEKEDFAVCVKGLSFEYNDQSVILVEWLENLFAMGVSKIYIYVLNVHPNMWKVLKYYDNLGKIEVRRHTLSATNPNIPGYQHDYLKKKMGQKRLEELIPYNDCYYDNMNLYKYIALLDIDELIVPKEHLMTWKQLLDFLEPAQKYRPEDIDGYGFRDVIFHDGNHTYEHIPPFLRFANVITREAEPLKKGQGTKSWFSTDNILTLHNHYSFNLLSPDRKSRYKKWVEVDPEFAHMQHYCFNKVCGTKNVTIDNTLWKYNDIVIGRSLKALEDLQFIRKKRY